MKKNSEKKMIKWSVQENYTCYIQLVPILKTNKTLKLLPVDMKANSSILMRLEMTGMVKTSKKALFSLWSLELE